MSFEISCVVIKAIDNLPMQEGIFNRTSEMFNRSLTDSVGRRNIIRPFKAKENIYNYLAEKYVF